MRRVLLLSGAALLVIAGLWGCARKADQGTTETSSDSLLTSNPVEQPQGNLAPQTEYQQPEPEPPQTEKPRATSTSKPRAPQPTPRPSAPAQAPGVALESGTPVQVSVTGQISSETVKDGDPWSGEVKEPVVVGSTVVIPAGSTVSGVVEGVLAAEKGSRAFLLLAVRSITVGGNSYAVSASTDSIIAGSTRARNLGAIAGSAAAGALIGKAVGGSGKGALIGGLIGGAAATGVVAKSKGYQVVIKEGTVIDFKVDRKVMMRS
jgi:hypothetical protein